MTVEKDTGQLPLWTDVDRSGEWCVRVSRRARRLSVRVHLTGRVEIIVPPRTPARAVARFVGEHREWIARRRAEARRNAPPEEHFPPHGIILSASGEQWQVHLAGGSGTPRASMPAPLLLRIAGDASDFRALRAALRRWLLSRARAVLDVRLDALSRELGLKYRRLAVRRQRTRWGSCSVRGTISLNCCLLFQRPEVVRYLLIHELVHTIHMNHSERFWRRVAAHVPDWRRLDRELLDGWRRVPAWVFDDQAPR